MRPALFLLTEEKIISILKKSSSSPLAARRLRSPPYDKSTSNRLSSLRVSYISVGDHHKEGYDSIHIARPKALSFWEEAIRR
jgi:hypothetical protein